MGGKTPRDGLLKDGTSRRARAGRRRGMPPIMWVAVAACVAGAFFLFRGQGGGGGEGIGERQSVVAVGPDTAAIAPPDAPRSGDVDIDRATRELVPESPGDGRAAAAPAEATAPAAEPAPAPRQEAPARAETTPSPPDPEPEAGDPRITPAAHGAWVVQVGSFGDAANADKEAARLRAAGLDARVKMGNLADGSIAYRVRVGYFGSREQARAFARQERQTIPGAIAVHR